MIVVRTLAMALLALTFLPTAHAGIPTCTAIQIVEIFPGTEECPNAQYVMLRMTLDLQGAVGNTRVEVGSGTFATFPPGDAQNELLGDALLAATARAEGLFGITADAVAPGDVLLDLPQDTVTYTCSGDSKLYGDVPPYPELGMALKRDGPTWRLGPPAPFNNAGQSGTLGACPPEADAGAAEPAMDATTMDAAVEEEDAEGCGCRIGSGRSARSLRAPAWTALLLLAALLTARRPT